jgi:Cu+-exporting ATPase
MKSRFAKLISAFTLALLLAGTALAADQTAKFKVTGMYCSACQTKIHQALSKTDGVKSATVDLNSGSATVTFDDAKVKPQQIIKIIEEEGYKAELQKKS